MTYVFHSTHRQRHYGPLVRRAGGIHLPMVGSSELLVNPHAAKDNHAEWLNIDEDKVTREIASRVSRDFAEPFCFDYEPYSKYRGPWVDAIDAYRTIYDVAKAYAPNAQVGFFGPPGTRARANDRDGSEKRGAAFYKALWDTCDIVFPQLYIGTARNYDPASGIPPVLLDNWREALLKTIFAANEIGKPWIGVLSHVMRHPVMKNDNGKAMQIPTPVEVTREIVRMVIDFGAEDGMCLWGWTKEYDPLIDAHFAASVEGVREEYGEHVWTNPFE